MPTLSNPRWERFAQELANGVPAPKAYATAGYKGADPGNASHLQAKPQISQRIAELLKEREHIHAEGTAKAIEKMALTQEWVLTRLMENAERALQHVAVLDKERKPTGEYRYDGNVANRALELLGKQQGMFIDRHEVGQPNEFANWTDEELEAFIKSGTKPLGIAPGKTQH